MKQKQKNKTNMKKWKMKKHEKRRKISERFMGRWQGRGDRSVFVTSHRLVHCSRALCCHSGSSYCVTSVSCRTGVWFSFNGHACLSLNTHLIHVIATGKFELDRS